ncbi:hypothetical protein RN001_000401 [Aquatica leii]|uniref:Uncharacterized protein n=1 Tax=Aquatica leii TaxID=1421715 RepID=A0AAN7SSF8_9COLE|nr:hypothetical protein RN001_000401 [Aquatica leii]
MLWWSSPKKNPRFMEVTNVENTLVTKLEQILIADVKYRLLPIYILYMKVLHFNVTPILIAYLDPIWLCYYRSYRHIQKTFRCNKISDCERKKMFEEFWKFNTWGGKAFVKGLVITRAIKRRRKQTNNNSKKKTSLDIYLPSYKGLKVRVCRTFFLNTLNLGRDTFNRWNLISSDLATTDDLETIEQESNETSNQPSKRKKTIVNDKIREWLNLLPKVPSHYCRSSSKKIYQIYLKKGHTMIQADSVHSTLEHYFNPPINSPADYISRMRAARPKKPCNVIPLYYTFFLNYEALSSILPSLRPGKQVGDPAVTDIRGLKYLPNGEILSLLRLKKELACSNKCLIELFMKKFYSALHL